ncbi:MAG: GDP-L-fucose synthase [Bradymonadaceae bacterium]|nr:GDP-L-fucose synthase [Lujinxingiaceae bacterium]
MTPEALVYVAGHRGLAGSAIVRALQARGYQNILTRTKTELDLTIQAATDAFFAAHRPEFVILAAAKVGGILANATYPADFITDNLLIQTHVIDAAHRHATQRLLFLGSSCIYPRDCPQPIREEYLLTGPLEPTNAPYALAKIAGIAHCHALNTQHHTRYLPVMPTNLYGPHDNFDPHSAHVLPALIARFHHAKLTAAPHVTLWGSGTPRREFLHADDLATACLHLLEHTDETRLLNIGTAQDLPILELAHLIADIVGYQGDIVLDPTKPDGTPQKLLDTTRIQALGWTPTISLEKGIEQTYSWFQQNVLSTP